MTTPRFALNHMAAAQLDLAAFCELAAGLRLSAIEIRNDLPGRAILDGTPAETVRETAARHDLSILSINALQKFNRWSSEREAEAVALADYARAAGAAGLVLVPTNDGSGRGDGERQDSLRTALAALAPILSERGVAGLVEPLGFETSSLRSKREAAEAIAEVAPGAPFRLVHDTFHHHLAGEPELFAELTGLVHISGVENETLSPAEMRDEHRKLVDVKDRLGNAAQMRALMEGGYSGYFSFEPFASSIHGLPNPAAALAGSMDYLKREVLRAAA